MSEKQEIIQKMLQMQKSFIAKEQANGVSSEEYYQPASGDDLDGYQEKYNALANRLVDLAHEERGSRR
ncbi:MAG: hypothetical protein GKR96_03520 [Gammaproteobacteria bacterium]|nr:hypothetical protein [Gammaproteobacteria bacterium]